MDNNGDASQDYWESLHQIENLSWGGINEALPVYYDSSSPDGIPSPPAPKNIVAERNRRKLQNDRLFALRALVPNITKMDKASIIKDAIDYINLLHDEERRIQSEITELESRKLEFQNLNLGQQTELFTSMDQRSKKKRMDEASGSMIEDVDLSVSHAGPKGVVVKLKCSKRRDTIVKLCEVFEALNLNIVNATIYASTESLFNTLFIQVEEEETDILKMQIERAIFVALNHPQTSTIM